MTFHTGYWFTNTYDRIYGKNVFYMYVMTVYHVLIPFWMVWFGFNKPHTFAIINPANFYSSKGMSDLLDFKYMFVAIAWAVIITLLDMFFFAMLKFHFKHAVVTWSKKHKWQTDFLSWYAIGITEVIVFGLSFITQPLREVMLFLSLNTIQVTIAYVVMTKIPFGLGRLLMITVAWLFVIQLLIFPIFH